MKLNHPKSDFKTVTKTQSYKINLILKLTKLVLNSSMVHNHILEIKQ